jgi:dTDP-4-dehydrorhamnose 3,5-epimerase
MIFLETRIPGVFAIDIVRQEDSRGYFARTFCVDEFSAIGLQATFSQVNVSFNAKRGTLRGLHFQYPPAAQAKYVRCMRGTIFDVVVDLRPEAPTYLDHVSVHLSAKNGRGLYVPERFAHGFITLEDSTEVSYLISGNYGPGAEGGLRYDDPGLRIIWPLQMQVISTRDTLWKPIAEIEDLKSRMSVSEPTT